VVEPGAIAPESEMPRMVKIKPGNRIVQFLPHVPLDAARRSFSKCCLMDSRLSDIVG
jgi:hypothetical protein